MDDLQVKHLEKNLAEALERIDALKLDVKRLKNEISTIKARKNGSVKTNEHQEILDLLEEKREELRRCKELSNKRKASSENWKLKYQSLRDRVIGLTKELTK